ncbi:outer membrane protein assembly factor BamB family protein [Microscilla marina]|uniref:outer membrane protein assembly factor BamB family protein n=1 Tax=Microscilla marina TaxID=1027 RepID=UPI0005D48339|nr:PQQ-binding-like beta-propeller repeat protein [Microscilla marina]
MADEVGRRGCSGMVNLGISVIVLLLLGWFFTQDKLSFSDLTKRIGSISGVSPKVVLRTMPLVDSPTLTMSDVLVVSVKKDIKHRKNAENQYEIHLAYRSAANQVTQWETNLNTLYKDGHNYLKTTYDREHVYILVKDFVYALKRNSGEKVWSLRLRDQLSPECSNCMALVQRKLILLTEDRILYSVNALNGNILRKNRLETPKAKGVGFYVVKDKVVLSDQAEDKMDVSASVVVINPITLMPMRLFTPTPHREIDSGKVYRVNMPMVFDNIGTHVYLMPEGTHIQCWDIDSGTKKWDKVLPSRVLLPYDIKNLRHIKHQTALYLSALSGSRSVLLKVDMLSGKIRELAKEIDYSLTPMVGRKNLVIAFTRKTRGNNKNELWGINHHTGMVAWRYPLRSTNLYNKKTKDGEVYHILHKGNLLIIQYLKETGQMLIEKMNPMNGNLIKKTVKDVIGNQWNNITVTKHKAYFSMGDVYELDLKTAEITRFDY